MLTKSFSTFILGIILLSLVVYPTNFVTAASDELKPCEIHVSFLVNDKPITGNIIYRDPANKYKVYISVKQPDDTTCQPAFFWKLSSQEYTPSPDPNEPTEIPAGTVIDSGQIVSNLDFSKSVNLGSAGLKTYAYTFFIAKDQNFTTSVYSKSVSVSFTDDPKKATQGGTVTGGGGTTPGTTVAGQAGASVDLLKLGLPEILNPSGATDITEIVTKFINWLLLILAMLSAVMIVYSGILLIFNGGDQARAAKGKAIITWAIIGMVVSLGAFAIVSIIQGILN